jgi:carboxyl-terminal processing protease
VVLVVSAVTLFAAGLSLGGRVGRDADEEAAVSAFAETYRRISDTYVGEAVPEELLEGAIRGMFETLDDPYSGYLRADEYESIFADVSGEFEGVGARMATQDAQGRECPSVGGDCLLRVVEVLPDTPALASGLRARDVVIAVDGQRLEGRTISTAVDLIRGPRDSRVVLSVQRDGRLLELPIVRGRILTQDVRFALLGDGGVGYLRIDGFSGRVADSFEAALRELLAADVRGIVLDLRDDPGGFVDAAVDIASQFIADGPVYWEEDASGEQRPVDVRGGGLATDPATPLVVLVDGGTASASEILAGALQDAGRARLVGERTFGKGSVQEWTRLPGQAGGFRLSVAEWLTRGRSAIAGVGLRPDVVVSLSGARYEPAANGEVAAQESLEADAQLRRALELLVEGEEATPGATDPFTELEAIPVEEATPPGLE